MRDRAGHLQSLQKKLFGDKKRGGGPKGEQSRAVGKLGRCRVVLAWKRRGSVRKVPGEAQAKGGAVAGGGTGEGAGGMWREGRRYERGAGRRTSAGAAPGASRWAARARAGGGDPCSPPPRPLTFSSSSSSRAERFASQW